MVRIINIDTKNKTIRVSNEFDESKVKRDSKGRFTREYGYYSDLAPIWGYDSVEKATAAADEEYEGNWDKDNRGLVARDIDEKGMAQDINATEIGGCDELIGDPYPIQQRKK